MHENAHLSYVELQEVQLRELTRLLGALPDNRFWAPRLQACGLSDGVASLADFRARMPLLMKADLARDQELNAPYGSNLTRPLEQYIRVHQTSSTTGSPLRWLDTAAGWGFMKRGWKAVFEAAGVTASDRVFVAFSFGPFVGLWLAFEAAQELGTLTLPGGALSSEMRLRVMLANEATVLCCTPTYALRLVEVAEKAGIDLLASHIRTIIVGAEPGGGIPAVRERIEGAWNGARLHDHYGLTEAGAVTFQCPEQPDVMHASESLYLVEVVDPETGEAIDCDGCATGELVLTTLGRADSPVLRYRTGDIVRRLPQKTCVCGRNEMAFSGGVIGRADDMVHVRGVNLFPSAVDAIVRGFEGVAEYHARIRTVRGMSEFELDIEPEATASPRLGADIEAAFRATYGLRIGVHLVAPGSLPRFEFKSRRWTRE